MELDFARAYLTRLSALPIQYSARYASERGRPETAHSESVALSSLLESGGILEESGECQ